MLGMDTLGKRIKRYREEAGLSQQQLAERCGWQTQSRVGNYELDKREPTLEDIKRIAKELGVPYADLVVGKASHPSGSVIPASHKEMEMRQDSHPQIGEAAAELPVLTWMEATRMLRGETVDLAQAEIEAISAPDAEAGAFLLQWEGDSMYSPDGSGFSHGEVLVVRPDETPEHGDAVVALLPGGALVFRRYAVGPDGESLEAINPAWPNRIMPLEPGARICGVVVSTIRRRKRRTTKRET